MTSFKTPQSNANIRKASQFKQACELWELERLYADLTTIKGEELSETEQLHLRGLLCGYNSSTLADKLRNSPAGLRSEISRSVNNYVKDLINQQQDHLKKPVKKLKSGDMLRWLEELGYRRAEVISSKGATIQIDAAIGSVVNVVKDKGRITFEINNSRVSFSLPTEEFSKLLAQSEENEEEK